MNLHHPHAGQDDTAKYALKFITTYGYKWLFSWSLEAKLAFWYIHLTFLNTHLHVGTSYFRFAFSLPKYGIILTTEHEYYYDNEGWSFYRKHLFWHLRFFIMHLEGEVITHLNEQDEIINS